jgi:trans-aconitate 2-methyltransferase
MAWDPNVYNKFKSARFAPFNDLIKLATIKSNLKVIDLGCGTGELTRKLADILPNSNVLGIDSSLEMLNDSLAFERKQVKFIQRSIEEQMNGNQKWDLIFSNAALQWVENHQSLFPKIISCLEPDGQLLVQIPNQPCNLTNQLLKELEEEEPFKTHFKAQVRPSPVLSMDEYATLFFENGSKSMVIYEKVYPLVLENSIALYDWVSGTALLPYISQLNETLKTSFIDRYQNKLLNRFPGSPIFYPFKRIIMEASF